MYQSLIDSYMNFSISILMILIVLGSIAIAIGLVIILHLLFGKGSATWQVGPLLIEIIAKKDSTKNPKD
jgi:type IV secretory pathway TrbD component